MVKNRRKKERGKEEEPRGTYYSPQLTSASENLLPYPRPLTSLLEYFL